MLSVISRVVIAFVLVALAEPNASADDRPQIAILGVLPKDPAVTRVASALTQQMRTLATAKTSAYRVIGSPKQIDKAILEGECSTIDTACAVALGAALGADYTLAGELDKRGTHHVLLLALVDVKKKQRIRSLRETSGSDAKKWAKLAFGKLVDNEAGELVLSANAKQGEIWIDGQLVGALFEGRASVGGLANGGHRLQIKARGYKPFEVDITVEFVTKQSVLLEPL